MARSLTFGQWMCQVRIAKKMTAVECAERASMAPSVWSNWENDRSRRKDGKPSEPKKQTIEAVARALDVPISEAMQAAFGPSPSPAGLSSDAKRRKVDLIINRIPAEKFEAWCKIAESAAEALAA